MNIFNVEPNFNWILVIKMTNNFGFEIVCNYKDLQVAYIVIK